MKFTVMNHMCRLCQDLLVGMPSGPPVSATDSCPYPTRIYLYLSEWLPYLPYSAPNTWNSLPGDIQLACSLTILKKRLKTFLFSAAFD